MNIKKFKLSQREVSSEEPSLPLETERLEGDKRPLSLGDPHVSQPYVSPGNLENDVEDYLEDAYGPERDEARRVRRWELVQNVASLLTLLFVSALLLIGYAHIIEQWPPLEPASWYVPFMLSVALSIYLCIRAYLYLKHARSYSLFAFGIAAAVGVGYWNVEVLRVASQAEMYSPTNGLWVSESRHEMLIAYEVNDCRGVAASFKPYQSVSFDQIRQQFRAMPRSEWKPYFRRYLSADELARVNSVNIDDHMFLVSERTQKARATAWESFGELYANPTFVMRLKQWAIYPYKLMLKRL